MASLAEILGAQPEKIRFQGGKPPTIGEVPRTTYAVLDQTRQLELLDGPTTSQSQPDTTPFMPNVEPSTGAIGEKPLSREEELRREMAEIAQKFNIVTTVTVERPDNTIFEWKSPQPKPAEPKVDKLQKDHVERPKPQVNPNKLRHDENMRIFSGQRGKTIYERGRVVNKKS